MSTQITDICDPQGVNRKKSKTHFLLLGKSEQYSPKNKDKPSGKSTQTLQNTNTQRHCEYTQLEWHCRATLTDLLWAKGLHKCSETPVSDKSKTHVSWVMPKSMQHILFLLLEQFYCFCQLSRLRWQCCRQHFQWMPSLNKSEYFIQLMQCKHM